MLSPGSNLYPIYSFKRVCLWNVKDRHFFPNIPQEPPEGEITTMTGIHSDYVHRPALQLQVVVETMLCWRHIGTA